MVTNNWLAPPCKNRTSYSSGTPSSARQRSIAGKSFTDRVKDLFK